MFLWAVEGSAPAPSEGPGTIELGPTSVVVALPGAAVAVGEPTVCEMEDEEDGEVS